MDGIVLLAHGTIEDLSELPDFLKTIRRGREPSPELLAEMRHRYQAIGGSPLLELTRQQAAALEEKTHLPCFVAMRLWHPTVEQVLPQVAARGVNRACLLPLAPFSVDVYVAAAKRAQSQLSGAAAELQLLGARPWGTHPAFVDAHVNLIRSHLPADATPQSVRVVLTAHSLPLAIIRGGDGYADEVSACALAIDGSLGYPTTLAYQSEGTEGQWLGPALRPTLEACAARGERRVVLAPFGFLADHVETLYDLDMEAQSWAKELDIELTRVPALNTNPRFIDALADIALTTLQAG